MKAKSTSYQTKIFLSPKLQKKKESYQNSIQAIETSKKNMLHIPPIKLNLGAIYQTKNQIINHFNEESKSKSKGVSQHKPINRKNRLQSLQYKPLLGQQSQTIKELKKQNQKLKQENKKLLIELSKLQKLDNRSSPKERNIFKKESQDILDQQYDEGELQQQIQQLFQKQESTIQDFYYLANQAQKLRRHKESILIYKKTIKKFKLNEFSSQFHQLAYCHSCITNQMIQNNYPWNEIQPHSKKAIQIYERDTSTFFQQLITLKSNISIFYEKESKFSIAASHYESVIELEEKYFPTNDERRYITCNNFASFCCSRGLKLFQKTLSHIDIQNPLRQQIKQNFEIYLTKFKKIKI